MNRERLALMFMNLVIVILFEIVHEVSKDENRLGTINNMVEDFAELIKKEIDVFEKKVEKAN